MNRVKKITAVLLSILLLTVPLEGTAFASEKPNASSDSVVSVNDNIYQFSDEVVVLPQGTNFEIDEDSNTVKLFDCEKQLQRDDTFVLFWENLPIGYVAREIERDGDDLVVSVVKADDSIYENVREQGTIDINEKNSEFVPSKALASSGIDFDYSYKDGILHIELSDDVSSISTDLSDLKLNHSFGSDGLQLLLNGSYDIDFTVALSQNLVDATLGELRIAGVGVIKFGFDMTQTLSVSAKVSGTFKAGIEVEGGNQKIVKDFTANPSVEGSCELRGAFKISAGLDILVANALVYTEIGFDTKTSTSYHTASNDKVVKCEDWQYYIFLSVGASASYHAFWSDEDVTVTPEDFGITLPEPVKPFDYHVHYEDGNYVGSRCSFGEEYSVPDLGGVLTKLDPFYQITIGRVLETTVTLPCDLVLKDDLILNNGTLSLNGHTLTIDGDLIQTGGTLVVDGGTLNVKGNYYQQNREGDTVLGDSTGMLDIRNKADIDSSVNVDGDLIIQTSGANRFASGTITVKGNLYQKDTESNEANFNFDNYMTLIMDGDGSQVLSIDSPDKNRIWHLITKNDVSVPGDFRLCNADLKGHKLIIWGNLLQPAGEIYINSGELDVKGSYYMISNSSVPDGGTENMTASDAVVKMVNDNDVLRINEDFVTASKTPHTDLLTAGTMYLGGDFTQIVLSTCTTSFNASGTHKIVFNGTNRQKITFGNYTNSGFSKVQFINPKIELASGIRGFVLNEDIDLIIKSSLFGVSGTMNLNGHSLGDNVVQSDSLTFSGGTLKLSGSTFKVKKDLIHTSGTINVSGGTLDIPGDYYIAGSRTSDESGVETVTACSAILMMTNDSDTVKIGGDFLTASSTPHNDYLTAGTMYIGGDFTQKVLTTCTSQFNATGTHTVVFNGTNRQTIYFGKNEASGFSNVRFTNPKITFATGIRGFTLHDDIELKLSNYYLFINGTLDLNGHSVGDKVNTTDQLTFAGGTLDINGGTFTVKGDLLETGGDIIPNGGTLDVSGDYYIAGSRTKNENGTEDVTYCRAYLRMKNDADVVKVGGDFLMYTKSGHKGLLEAGTMYIAGNFTQKDTSDYLFAAGGTHKVVLSGEEKQIITFEGMRNWFNILELTKDISNYEFNPYGRWNKLILPPVDLVESGASLSLEETDFVYDGTEKQPQVKVVLNDTELVADKDYTVEYVNNVNAGTATATVTGIGAYIGSLSTEFIITKAPQEIEASIDPIAVGKTASIQIKGAYGDISYLSSDEAIAKVSAEGKVSAMKVGTAEITISAADTENYEAGSATVTVKVVPGATSSLKATNLASGVKLTWKKVTGATGYLIYRGSKKLKTISSGSTLTYTDKDAANGTKYTYKVVAKAATGNSTLSKSVTTYRLTRPSIKSLTNSASKAMTVKWSKNSKTTGYKIQYSLKSNFSSATTVTVKQAGTLSKKITGLKKGKTYYVRVRCYKGSSYSAWSTVKSVKISK